MADDINTVLKKMVRAMIDAKGYPYTVGYMESYLADVITRNVSDEEIERLKTEMRMITSDQIVESM
jgi:hypothetical protein